MTKRLPEPDEPLTLADGTVIQPDGKPVIEEVEVPTHEEARELVVQTRRKLVDLPDIPEKMNPIAAVMGYHLFGLNDAEIAVALGTDQNTVGNIRMSDGYTTMLKGAVQQWLDSEAAGVNELLTREANAAARTMTDLLSSPSDSVRLAASKDVLDRTGNRPVDRVLHTHEHMGGLIIEHVRSSDNDLPPIDLTPGN